MDGRETGLSSDADSGLPPVDQASDKKDVTGTDGKETGISSDASDVPPADSKPELGPETIRHDAGPDLAPDASPDLPGGLDTSPLLVGLLAYYKCEGATGTTLELNRVRLVLPAAVEGTWPPTQSMAAPEMAPRTDPAGAPPSPTGPASPATSPAGK